MSLNQLPVDIYINVYSLLEPNDIRALSQVCSLSRIASEERIVWITALRSNCAANHILPSTFKTNKMTLNELKHAATAPSRVLSAIYKGDFIGTEGLRHTLHPKSHHQLQLDDTDLSLDNLNVCFIPGGRFLLVHGGDQLILYDLGILKPVCTIGSPFQFRYDDNWPFIPAPSLDGKEIRVLMSRVLYNNSNGIEILVVRLVLNEEDDENVAAIQHKAVFPSSFSSFRHSVSTLVGDLVIFINPRGPENQVRLGMWNYIQNTFAAWWIPRKDYKEIFVDGKHIVLVAKSALYYWEIPPFTPHSDYILETPPASFSIPLSFSLPRGTADPEERRSSNPVIFCARPFDWYNTYERVSTFDFIFETPNYEMFTRFSLPIHDPDDIDPMHEYTHGPPPHSIVMFKKAKEGPVREPYISWMVSTSPYAICNGEIVKPFMENGRVYVTVTADIQPPPTGAKLDPVVQLVLPDGIHADDPRYPLARKNFYFDPSSGRLAYLSNKCTSIVVVDYLRYP